MPGGNCAVHKWPRLTLQDDEEDIGDGEEEDAAADAEDDEVGPWPSRCFSNLCFISFNMITSSDHSPQKSFKASKHVSVCGSQLTVCDARSQGEEGDEDEDEDGAEVSRSETYAAPAEFVDAWLIAQAHCG